MVYFVTKMTLSEKIFFKDTRRYDSLRSCGRLQLLSRHFLAFGLNQNLLGCFCQFKGFIGDKRQKTKDMTKK